MFSASTRTTADEVTEKQHGPLPSDAQTRRRSSAAVTMANDVVGGGAGNLRARSARSSRRGTRETSGSEMPPLRQRLVRLY